MNCRLPTGDCRLSKVRPGVFWAVIVRLNGVEAVHPQTINYLRDAAWRSYEKLFPFPKDAKAKLTRGEVRLAQVVVVEMVQKSATGNQKSEIPRRD